MSPCAQPTAAAWAEVSSPATPLATGADPPPAATGWRTRSTAPLGSSQPVRSVSRALRLLEVVGDGPPEGLPLTAIASELRLAKSTVLASARTLVEHGFLRAVEPGPRYRLGTALIAFGELAAEQNPLGEVCLDLLQRASDASGLTARLALAEDGYPVCVRRVDGPGLVRFAAPLGRREPPYATAAGKSILATY